MSTLLNLFGQGHLVKIDAALSWREQEERMIFATPAVARWIAEELEHEASNWNLELTPIEQLDDLLWQFCSGQELIVERQFRPLRHIRQGVWELKTGDLRLFGWFAQRDCFVCAAADTALNVKEHKLYAGYRDQVARIRDGLELDEPKFIPGDDFNDILTDWDYPAS